MDRSPAKHLHTRDDAAARRSDSRRAIRLPTSRSSCLPAKGENSFRLGPISGCLTKVTPEFQVHVLPARNETLARLEQTPKLVIAAPNGHCVGGGPGDRMAADLRIARKDAGKIGLSRSRAGVLPGTGGMQRLARLVGKIAVRLR